MQLGNTPGSSLSRRAFGALAAAAAVMAFAAIPAQAAVVTPHAVTPEIVSPKIVQAPAPSASGAPAPAASPRAPSAPSTPRQAPAATPVPSQQLTTPVRPAAPAVRATPAPSRTIELPSTGGPETSPFDPGCSEYCQQIWTDFIRDLPRILGPGPVTGKERAAVEDIMKMGAELEKKAERDILERNARTQPQPVPATEYSTADIALEEQVPMAGWLKKLLDGVIKTN
jgi:hypothetical protein